MTSQKMMKKLLPRRIMQLFGEGIGFRRFAVSAVFLACYFLLGPACFAENGPDIDGFYTMPSGSCDQYKGKKREKCQASKPRDCLLLKHESTDTIRLEVSRDQVVTVCSVHGVAHVENGRIIYKHLGLLDKEVSFELVVSDKFLTFKDVTKERPRDPICGIHGDLDGVRFERRNKIKTARTCSAD